MAVDLSAYKTVPERLAEARVKFPEARLVSRIVDLPAAFADKFIAVEATFYRTPTDQHPATGLAWEPVPGKTPYTRDSELMNAETSAWGRAVVAALVADTARGIASQEEVRNRHGVDPDQPARDTNRAKLEVYYAAHKNKHRAKASWDEAAASFGLDPDSDIGDYAVLTQVTALALDLARQADQIEVQRVGERVKPDEIAPTEWAAGEEPFEPTLPVEASEPTKRGSK